MLLAREARTPVELTPMQLAMLLESVPAQCPWANLEQISATLPGMDSSRLRAAWSVLAERHDALRLQVSIDDTGLPAATIRERALWDFSVVSVSGGMDAALGRHLGDDRLRGLGPGCPSPALWRVALLGEGRPDATMVWTIHHAIIDGESIALVMRDLGLILEGEDLGPQAASFGQFLASVATAADPDTHALLTAYLEDAPAPAVLAPAAFSLQPDRRKVARARLDPSVSEALQTRARAMDATSLNMVQAAWGLALSRWCGRDDVVFGLVGAGRSTLPDHRETVGCLINTLPMRVRTPPSQTCAQLVRSLRADTLTLRQGEHFPASRLSPGSGPLFDTVVMYTRRRLPSRLAELDPRWSARNVTLTEEGSAPVTLAVYDDAGLLVELEHDPVRLPAEDAQRLLDGFCALVVALSTCRDDAPLASLAMLTPLEEAEVLALGQPERVAEPPTPCISRWHSATVERHGTRPAIISASGQVVSHAALARQVDAMARYLSAQGIGEGDIVALALPRVPALVVAMLGVLRLGGAFVPIDGSFPEGAVQRMLADSGACALVAPPGRNRPEGFAGLMLSPPRADSEQVLTPPPPLPAPDPARPTYVIFTSGSTGRPKAVLGLTGALCAHAAASIDAFALTPADRVLQFAGLSFDVMLEEVFPTLLAGGTVVLRDEGCAGSIERLLAFCAEHGVSVANLPASFWGVLVDAVETGAELPASLRLMISGSEKIDTQMLARWRAAAPELAFINGYGPTETTITATALSLPAGAPLPDGDVPIGRAMGHAHALILAPDGSLSPRGRPGLLWIGGAAVTGGYLNAPEATAARFAPDPRTEGGRLYNTGDRARWRHDGLLDFLGREDRQVKLRGFRIDLQQIEEEVRALPGLRQVHAAITTDAGAQRLVAWVQPQDLDNFEPEDLRARLAQTLPNHMIPVLVPVARFPTTPNGKIDPAALPVVSAESADLAGNSAEPVDPLTQRISDAMASVLGLERVDVDTPFQSLGGDSLQALKLVGLIERQTGHSINATDLYSHPTARALSEMLLLGSGGPRFIVPIQPKGQGTVFFAVHVLGRKEELFTPLAAALGTAHPVLGLTVGVPRSMDEIDVERIADIYFQEIQTHYPEAPIALGAVSMAAYFAYELAQRLLAAGRDVRLLAIFDAAGPDGRKSLEGRAKLGMHLQLLRSKGLAHIRDILYRRRQVRRDAENRAAMDPDALKIENLVAANVLAVNRYVPTPYARRLTIFRADQAVWDSPEAIRTGLGWASVAAGGFEVIDVPGDHLSILSGENVAALARHIAHRMTSED
jgi:amino acid adenylation domain-containing protein